MDPGQIDAEIERLMQTLEAETEAYGALAHEEAATRTARDVARAKALLAAGGTVAEREARATAQTAEADLAHRIAAAKADAQRELLRSLRANLDALRTLAANLRPLTG